MTPNEEKTLLETRLRNLKRKYRKLAEHPEFVDECRKLQEEINNIEEAIAMT